VVVMVAVVVLELEAMLATYHGESHAFFLLLFRLVL
jgi:hypothetical protein